MDARWTGCAQPCAQPVEIYWGRPGTPALTCAYSIPSMWRKESRSISDRWGGVSSSSAIYVRLLAIDSAQKGHARTVDHWDRGRGEPARHERRDSESWADLAPGWSDEPYSRPDGTYRTPSRRRARLRGAPEPVDSYTPAWARESTPPDTTPPWHTGSAKRRVGRHHRPDDADEAAPSPDRAVDDWRTTTGHGERDGWSTTAEPATPARTDARLTARWIRSPEEINRTVADPPSRRRRRGGGSRHTADTGQWSQLTDTGALDPIPYSAPPDDGSGYGRLDPVSDAGPWDRLTDTTERRRDELVGSGRHADPDDDLRTTADRGELFWSGTRLAGDDPRWMATPDSAPRSPAVAFPTAPRSAPPSRRRSSAATDLDDPAGSTSTRSGGSTRTRRSGGRAMTTAPRRRTIGRTDSRFRQRVNPLDRRLTDDLLDVRPSPFGAMLHTVAWYAVPVLVFVVWVLTLDPTVPADCVPELTGEPCRSERAAALAALGDGLPRFGAALLTSLLAAVLLRWMNRVWRTASIGLAAAVVGGGLSTVLFSVISGRPLG